jgi:hypothetical protein
VTYREATPCAGPRRMDLGSGANQNFTLVIGPATPESSTWAMMLLGFAGLCFAGYRVRAAADLERVSSPSLAKLEAALRGGLLMRRLR